MNKGILGGILAVIALVSIAGYFVLTNKTANPPSNQQIQTTTTIKEDTTNAPKSLKDLMGFAGNQMCTFTDVESLSKGSVYVGGGKLRGDFSSKGGKSTTTTHIVSDGSFVYVWIDGEKQGFKGSLETITKAGKQSADTKAKSVDPDKKVDYLCQTWTVDKNMFNLPDIKFTDYSSLMIHSTPSGKASSGSGSMDAKQSQCATCNSLPADAAAQCKAALGC